MVAYAKQLAKHGHHVYVYVANQNELNRFNVMFNKYPQIKLAVFAMALEREELSFNHIFQVKGVHDKSHILVDHYAIECTFGTMLKELHAYDEE